MKFRILPGFGTTCFARSFCPSFAVDKWEGKALALDRAIRRVKRADWRGNLFKEREVRRAIRSELAGDEELADAMFEIVKNQPDY